MDAIANVFAAILVFFSGVFSYVGHSIEYVAGPLSPPAHEARILFGGDMMFDRSIRAASEAKGGDFLFSCLDPVLAGHDLVVANLEGPITDNPSMSIGSVIGSPENFTFTFPTSTAPLLARHGIRLVNLGNNHMLNFSRDGLIQTKRYLNEAGVSYFGDPDSPEAERVARMDIHGIPFSFVNWSDWTSDKTDHTVAQVRLETESGRIVVIYTHWGEEYEPPPERVRQLAHSFVDAGAAIVIGSHPHIVQEHEVYQGKHIYYSLGNLIFDQYWNDAVSHGLMLDIVFTREGVASISEQEVVLGRDRRTCPLL